MLLEEFWKKMKNEVEMILLNGICDGDLEKHIWIRFLIKKSRENGKLTHTTKFTNIEITEKKKIVEKIGKLNK